MSEHIVGYRAGGGRGGAILVDESPMRVLRVDFSRAHRSAVDCVFFVAALKRRENGGRYTRRFFLGSGRFVGVRSIMFLCVCFVWLPVFRCLVVILRCRVELRMDPMLSGASMFILDKTLYE